MLEKSASLILPVHSDPDFGARREIIARLSAETGWRLLIPDYDRAAPAFDAERARATLAGVSLVIADLSLARPSCYFELGFAEALGKPVRLIAQAGAEIHQTGAREAVAFYEGRGGFEQALAAILAES